MRHASHVQTLGVLELQLQRQLQLAFFVGRRERAAAFAEGGGGEEAAAGACVRAWMSSVCGCARGGASAFRCMCVCQCATYVCMSMCANQQEEEEEERRRQEEEAAERRRQVWGMALTAALSTCMRACSPTSLDGA